MPVLCASSQTLGVAFSFPTPLMPGAPKKLFPRLEYFSGSSVLIIQGRVREAFSEAQDKCDFHKA
jgi:hypothetical protein